MCYSRYIHTCACWLLSVEGLTLVDPLPLLDPVALLLVVCVAGNSVLASVSAPQEGGSIEKSGRYLCNTSKEKFYQECMQGVKELRSQDLRLYTFPAGFLLLLYNL